MGRCTKLLLLTAVLLAVMAYWLHSPVPHGHSTATTMKLRGMFAAIKFVEGIATAGSYLGIDSYVNIMRRMAAASLKQVHDPAVTTKDTHFEHVRVRIYEPTGRTNVLPGIMYYHGGGWTLGSIEMYDDMMLILCKETNTVVVSVEYRLAPEHPFPVPFEDCVTATKYFLKNADKFKVDPNRIAVAGDSAGGNLAAAVSLKLRDDHFTPAIKLQVLIYPVLQAIDFNLPSFIQNANGPLLTTRAMVFFHGLYIEGHNNNMRAYVDNNHVATNVRSGLARTHLDVSRLPARYLEGYVRADDPPGDAHVWETAKDKLLNPYHSPLMADSVANLPTAYVFSAEYDPLRDESFLYVYRLREAGVDVTHVNIDVGFHAVMQPNFACQNNLEELCKFINTRL